MTQLADGVASGIEEFCGERTSTDTRTISLHDTINLANTVGTDTKTGACSGTDSVGRGDKGIASEIHVEHSALGTLAEDRLALTQKTVDLVL